MITHSRPKPEDFGEPDLQIAGFQLWVHGFEFPEAPKPYDADWLRVTAHCGGQGASVWASGAILMVSDLHRWANQIDALLKGEIKEAVLSPYEPALIIIISPSDHIGHDLLHVQITPDHMTQSHQFDFEIDQTFLQPLCRQCREIVTAHPNPGMARGNE